jgi:hypothetical protein
MNKCVSIFGGIGTKQSHYKHAIEVYKNNGYNVFFYPNKHIDLIIPARFEKNVQKALANDKTGTIIHTNSGGFWTGLEYLTKSNNNKLFISEAGPLECNTKYMITTFEKLYNVKCPNVIRNNIDTICDRIGIAHDKNIKWHAKYIHDLEYLRNIVCLTSKNDTIVSNEYIRSLIVGMNKDDITAKHYEFDSGSHWNISKTETQKYQDILQQHINQITCNKREANNTR